RQRGRDDRLVERREQQRQHQARVDREHAPDRVVVARWLVREARAQTGHSTGWGAGARCKRLSRIATAVGGPPRTWSGVIVSDSRITPKTAARKNCRFANSDARDGPTRSMAVNQSTFVITSGPATANANTTHTRQPVG